MREKGEASMESIIAGYILAGFIVITGIGFYIWLSIEVYNQQR